MNIKTAIEILTNRSAPRHQYYDQIELPAIKLGIEALKHRQRWEEEEFEGTFPLLPGETPEE